MTRNNVGGRVVAIRIGIESTNKQWLLALKGARSESEILRACMEYLRRVPGCVCWRANVGGMSGTHKGRRWYVRFGFPGLPDIHGWARYQIAPMTPWSSTPAPLYIEVKKVGGVVRPAQKRFLQLAREDGCIAGVVHSVDELRELLASHGVRCP